MSEAGQQRESAGVVACGPLMIDPKGRSASYRGKKVALTRLEFDLLLCLATHPGWVLSPEDLYERVWGYSWGADKRLVSVHVGNLRRKLGATGADPGLIQTIRGAGYKLVLVEDLTGQALWGGVRTEGAPAPRATGGRLPLVGRQAEMQILTEALREAEVGAGGTVLLCGEAGIGKTRLVEELGRHAASAEVRVLWGRCPEGEGVPAYWPWLQILRELGDEMGVEELKSCAGFDADSLLQLLPELRRATQLAPPQPYGDQYRLFRSVSRLLVRASKDRPCLLALDDLQWADQSSLLLLQVIAPELAHSRMLLVASIRNTDVTRGHLHVQVMSTLMRSGAQRLDLSGLARGAVEELMTAAAGTEAEPELVEAVVSETMGNPFHVCELVRFLRQAQPSAERLSLQGDLPLPPTIRDIVARRVGRLSAECQALLDLGALAGRAFGFGLLHRASQLERHELLGLLDEALEVQLLEEEGAPGRYRFSHPLVQEALVNQLSHLRRLKLHARLGEALLELNQGELDLHLAQLAHHFYEATPLGYVDQAVHCNLQAGRQALGQFAFDQAAGYFLRGLEALSFEESRATRLRAELLVELGEARAGAFDPSAREIYREAVDLARACGAADLFARAALGFEGRMMGPYSLDPERIELLEEALVLLAPGDSDVRVRLMSMLGKGLSELVDAASSPQDPFARKRRKALCDEAVSMARRLEDRRLLAHALNARWYALFNPNNLEQRLADTAEALALCEAETDPVLLWNSLLLCAYTELEIERIEEGTQHMERCREIAAQFRVPFFLAVSSCFQAVQAMLEGRLGDAQHLNREATAPWRDEQDWMGSAMSLIVSFHIALLHSEPEDFAALESPIRSLIPADPLRWAWRTRLGLLLAKLDRRPEARDVFEELAGQEFRDLPREQGFALFAAHLAETAVLLEDAPRAKALYDLLLPYDRRAASAFFFFDGPVAHYLGRLSEALAEWDRADAHFADAVARCSSMHIPPYEIRSRIARANALLERGRPADYEKARRELETALPQAQLMDMHGYAVHAREQLSVFGKHLLL